MDNRPAAVAQRELAGLMNNSPHVLQRRALSDAIHNSPRMVAQRHEMNALFGGAVRPQGDGAMSAELSPAQREEKPNHTGLPNQLKSGIESLSGMSMDHVKVHYNSHKPAQLQAHAYARGSEIHVGPGQERHLPHEAWHVVQQAQGRVKPTAQLAGRVGLNDDRELEAEASRFGAQAALRGRVDQNVRDLDTSAVSRASPAARDGTTVQRVVTINGVELTKKELGKKKFIKGNEKRLVISWIDNGSHEFSSDKDLRDKLDSLNDKASKAPPLRYIERNTPLFGEKHSEPDLQVDTFYRVMSEAELKAFKAEKGLTARKSKGKESGQQFISTDFDYCVKIAEGGYRTALAEHQQVPNASYRYLLRIDYKKETLHRIATHRSTRVGAGDNVSKNYFPHVRRQAENEKDGVMIIKVEPAGSETNKRPALNIGFTPKSEETGDSISGSDPRREMNQHIIYAEIHGEFIIPEESSNQSQNSSATGAVFENENIPNEDDEKTASPSP